MDAVGSCPWPLLPSCGLCPSMARPTRCPATHAGGHRGAPGRGGQGHMKLQPRGHVPETWMQGSSWHVPLFLCPTAWRRGSGGECAGHESPGDRQLPPLAWRPAGRGPQPLPAHSFPSPCPAAGLFLGPQPGGASREGWPGPWAGWTGCEAGQWLWRTAVVPQPGVHCAVGVFCGWSPWRAWTGIWLGCAGAAVKHWAGPHPHGVLMSCRPVHAHKPPPASLGAHAGEATGTCQPRSQRELLRGLVQSFAAGHIRIPPS